MSPTPAKKSNLIWQLCLALVFLCFGLLVMAQYNIHLQQSGSLEKESAANLGLILKSVNDNKTALENELTALTKELEQAQAALVSGDSLSASTVTRINTVKTAIGWDQVSGPGIAISITGGDNLVYQDLIDIVNELMNSGAEAVAINDVRFTLHTQINEAPRWRQALNEDTQIIEDQEYYVILVNGQELLYPIVIKAIGNGATMETAMTYPGGIVSSLSTLYGIYPTIRQAANLVIPAAIIPEYKYAEVKEQ